jgi:hypothetical protein
MGIAVLAVCALVVADDESGAGRDRSQLLAFHQRMLEAHLESDVDLLFEASADDYVIANRGEILRPTLEERKARLGPYLEATTFTEYKDLTVPVVRISADGSMGWVIAQVGASGVQLTPDGERPIEFVSAWIELYEKRDGSWVQVGNVSNFRGE